MQLSRIAGRDYQAYPGAKRDLCATIVRYRTEVLHCTKVFSMIVSTCW